MIIKFNNFKSFPNLKKNKLHELNFKRINLIYGLNNSGKSSIIQLLNLLSKNYEDYKFLKTNFEDLPLGQFDNILNNSSDKKKGLEIELYEEYIRNATPPPLTLERNLPSSGLAFSYNSSQIKRSTGEIKEFKIIFNYNLKKINQKTYFSFEDQKNSRHSMTSDSKNHFICSKIQIAEKCVFFDFSEIAEFTTKNKTKIRNKAKEINRAYESAKHSLINLNKQLDQLDNFKFDKKYLHLKNLFKINFDLHINNLGIHDVIDLNSLSQQFDWGQNLRNLKKDGSVQKFYGKTISNLRWESLRDYINSSKTNDTILKSFIKILEGMRGDMETLLNNEGEFSLLSLKKRPVNLERLVDEIYFRKSDESRLKQITRKLLGKTYQEIINKSKFSNARLKKMILHTSDLINLLKEINFSDVSFYIDQFYRTIGTIPRSEKFRIFTSFDFNSLKDFVNHTNNNEKILDKKNNQFFFKNLFINCLEKSLILENLSEDVEFHGLENNLLQIFSSQGLDSRSVLLSLPRLRLLLNRFTTVRPLLDITKVNNYNCSITERFYQIKNFEKIASHHKYDQNHIINNIFYDKKLFEKINKQLIQVGFDIKIDFKDQGSNNEGIIIPVLKDNKNNHRGYIADAGQAVKKMIPLIYYLNKTNDSVITLEEPEANIHPQYQANLADIILQSLNESNNELVIETHSELLILRFLKLIRDKRVSRDDITIHFIQNKNNKSEILPIEINETGSLETEWPGGFFKERLKEFF